MKFQYIFEMFGYAWVDEKFHCPKCDKASGIMVHADSCYVHSRALGMSLLVTNRVRVLTFCPIGHTFRFSCEPEQLVKITKGMLMVRESKPF